MRSPQMMGVELPLSGKGIFQRTFSVTDQRRGRSFSAQWPEPSGPRQAGQFAAGTTEHSVSSRAAAVILGNIIGVVSRGGARRISLFDNRGICKEEGGSRGFPVVFVGPQGYDKEDMEPPYDTVTAYHEAGHAV